MAKRRTVGLIAFLKGNTDPEAEMPGCANYDHHYGGCLLRDVCLVQGGKRCAYFERAVLPTGTTEVYRQYEHQCNIALSLPASQVRLCACGAILGYRQRLCGDCRRKNRRASYRQSRQKKAG